MALPRSRSFLGIAKETRPTPGLAPTAVAATDFIPFTTITPFDNITYLDDKGIRGSMTEEYNVIQGKIHSEFDFGGNVHADTIGYMLSGVLGDVTTTGSVPPYSHAIALLNSQATNGQPTTFTISDYYSLGAGNTRLFAGCQFSEIDVKFSADALLTYSTKAFGYQSVASTNPVPSFSSVSPIPAWSGSVTFAGASTAFMSEGNVKISRPVTPIFTVDGTQRPYQLFAGPVAVEGSMLLVMESDAQLNYYLNNTQPAVSIQFSEVSPGTTKLTFTMTKCAFTVGKVERGKDYIEVNTNFKALANTTDVGSSAGFSPIKATVVNSKVSGTYA